MWIAWLEIERPAARPAMAMATWVAGDRPAGTSRPLRLTAAAGTKAAGADTSPGRLRGRALFFDRS